MIPLGRDPPSDRRDLVRRPSSCRRSGAPEPAAEYGGRCRSPGQAPHVGDRLTPLVEQVAHQSTACSSSLTRSAVTVEGVFEVDAGRKGVHLEERVVCGVAVVEGDVVDAELVGVTRRPGGQVAASEQQSFAFLALVAGIGVKKITERAAAL